MAKVAEKFGKGKRRLMQDSRVEKGSSSEKKVGEEDGGDSGGVWELGDEGLRPRAISRLTASSL